MAAISSTLCTSTTPPRRILQAADALATNPAVCGRTYFISQGEPVNCWRWIDDLLTLASLPPVTREISTAAAWRLGIAWETAYRLLRIEREPPMTRFLAAQLGRSHWFDISAARRDLGYQGAVSTAQGMRNLKQWFDQQHCARSDEILKANRSRRQQTNQEA